MSTQKVLKLGVNFQRNDGAKATGAYGGSAHINIQHYKGSYGDFVRIISDGKHRDEIYMTPTDALALSFILFDFASEAGVVPKED